MNNKGSISIFLMLAMMVLSVAFVLYGQQSRLWGGESRLMRTLVSVAGNVQAAYDSDLYKKYGLLALDPDQAKREADESFIVTPHPLGLGGTYEYSIEPIVKVSNLSEVAGQMVGQAIVEVPESFLMEQKAVLAFMEKVKTAREETLILQKVADGLEKAKLINEDLERAIDRLNEIETMIHVRVSSTGKLSIDMSKLESEIAECLGLVGQLQLKLKGTTNSANSEKMRMQNEASEYPEGFMDSLTVQYRDLTDEIDNRAGQLDRTASDVKRLKKLLVEMDALERELKDLYSDESERIALEKEASERRRLRRKLVGKAEKKVDALIDRYRVKIEQTAEAAPDRGMEKLVQNIQDDAEDVRKGNNGAGGTEDDADLLTKNVIPVETRSKLPSKLISDEELKLTPLEYFALTEYYMGTFRHRLTGKLVRERDFYGMQERPSFFEDGEIEYILYGRTKEEENRLRAAGEIFLMREAVNCVHVYTCKDKVKLARTLSALVARPAWTKPVVFHGILLGWASLESGMDMKALLNGENVPVFKWSDEDWTTSLPDSSDSASANRNAGGRSSSRAKKSSIEGTSGDGVSASEGDAASKKDSNPNMRDYGFYMRLMLNRRHEDGSRMVGRALDLIALNENYTEGPGLDQMWVGFQINAHWMGRRFSIDKTYE